MIIYCYNNYPIYGIEEPACLFVVVFWFSLVLALAKDISLI
jgi:hypothetical protein